MIVVGVVGDDARDARGRDEERECAQIVDQAAGGEVRRLQALGEHLARQHLQQFGQQRPAGAELERLGAARPVTLETRMLVSSTSRTGGGSGARLGV